MADNWWDAAPKADSFDVALAAEGVTGKQAAFARSIYQQESGGGRNTKTSNAGAVGGMQIIPSTFSSVADKDWSISDPVQNARAGIRYALKGLDAAGGDPALAGAYYYGGPGGLEKAKRGVAVADPRNPNAPTTLQYGQQVAARIPKETGFSLMGTAHAGTLPASEGEWWASAPVAEAPLPADTPRVEVRGTSADEPSLLQRLNTGFLETARDTTAGLVRGAGSIGATILAPYDIAQDAMAGKGLSLESNRERRAGIDGGLRELGANTDSLSYGAGKLGGELAGTAGVGTALALPLKGVPAAARFANSLRSGGLALGEGAGGVVGNTLLRAAGGSIAGGVGAGLVDPQLASTGAVIGAAAGPVVKAVGSVAGGIGGAARAVRDTFTKTGQRDIAANVLRLSATDPEAAALALAQAKPVVPGSQPTLGQVATDPGLAQLERTLANNPATAPGLQGRYAQQRAARAAQIDEVAATGPNSGSYYDDIVEGRRVFANEDYAAARQAGIDPEMAGSMQAEIASLMERPSIKAAAGEAKRLAAETGEVIDDMGSVQGIDWLRKALANQIGKAKGSGATEDVRALTQTYNDLGSTLEQIAPKYAEANRNYAAMSKQINSMDVARDLERRYTPASNEYGPASQENGAAYMKALRAAQDSVKKATGREGAIGEVMATGDVNRLENVARDLARKEYSQQAGRAVGSPTAQNLISQNFIQQIMEGAGLPASAAMENTLLNTLLRPVQFAGKMAEPRVNDILTELVLNPQAASEALRRLPAGAQKQQLSRLLTNAAPVVPRIEIRGTSADR